MAVALKLRKWRGSPRCNSSSMTHACAQSVQVLRHSFPVPVANAAATKGEGGKVKGLWELLGQQQLQWCFSVAIKGVFVIDGISRW